MRVDYAGSGWIVLFEAVYVPVGEVIALIHRVIASLAESYASICSNCADSTVYCVTLRRNCIVLSINCVTSFHSLHPNKNELSLNRAAPI